MDGHVEWDIWESLALILLLRVFDAPARSDVKREHS